MKITSKRFFHQLKIVLRENDMSPLLFNVLLFYFEIFLICILMNFKQYFGHL
jgi:hypothetical protein